MTEVLTLTPEQRARYFDENGVVLTRLELDPAKLHGLLLLTDLVRRDHPSVRRRFATLLELTPEQSAAIARATGRATSSLALVHTGQHATYEEAWRRDRPAEPIGESFVAVLDRPPGPELADRHPLVLACADERAQTTFGTGLHPTTRLVLTQLERRPPRAVRVLDLGTGSGILAVAAGRLGARAVLALDTDDEAVTVARRTVAANGMSDRIEVRQGDLAAAGGARFELVLANVLGSVLVSLASALAARLTEGGTLIVSGFRAARRELMIETFDSEGLRVEDEGAADGWLALTLRRDA